MPILRERYLDLPTQASFLRVFLFEILWTTVRVQHQNLKETFISVKGKSISVSKQQIKSRLAVILQFAAVRVFIEWTIPQSRADSHLVWALMKSALFTSSYPTVAIRICPVITPLNQFIAAPPCRSNGTGATAAGWCVCLFVCPAIKKVIIWSVIIQSVSGIQCFTHVFAFAFSFTNEL